MVGSSRLPLIVPPLASEASAQEDRVWWSLTEFAESTTRIAPWRLLSLRFAGMETKLGALTFRAEFWQDPNGNCTL